jgi:hypothetical protein
MREPTAYPAVRSPGGVGRTVQAFRIRLVRAVFTRLARG